MGGYNGPDRAFSDRHRGAHHPRAAFRTGRTPRVFAIAHPADSVGLQFAVGGRRRRPFRSSTPSPAAARSKPAATIRRRSTRRPISTHVVGRHSLRAGFVFDATHYRSDATSNYLGLYTFESLTAYEAESAEQLHQAHRRSVDRASTTSRPASTCRTTSACERTCRSRQGSATKSQSHVPDRANLGPRLGFTWAPAVWRPDHDPRERGNLYDWLPTSTADQVVRLDGFHQQEVNVVDPSFPVDESTAIVPPVNQYALSPNYEAPRITRFSGGIDQSIRKVTRISATYSYHAGARLAPAGRESGDRWCAARIRVSRT